MKSNFNLTTNKNIGVTNLYHLIKHIVEILAQTNKNNITLEELKGQYWGHNVEIVNLIIGEVNNTLGQIENQTLIENINWGIHPINCLAIPYINKDKPLLQSNFSSPILTIFLTLYYFIIIKTYSVDKFIVNHLTTFKLLSKLFHIEDNLYNVDIEILDDLFEKYNRKIKFDELFGEIFNKFNLANSQYNTSFVDIINIDFIFKVGYSGTLNVHLPPIKNNSFGDVEKDWDEPFNIKYSIANSKILEIEELDYNDSDENIIRNFFQSDIILDYQALIDVIGLFKNIDNKVVAQHIYDKISKTKPVSVIYLDSQDKKFVITKEGSVSYQPNYYYINPFFYYSQTHIVGIDINQDKYPVLSGLCIINSKSPYSQVAQSMFRLRKLNQGHSIDFLFLNKTDDISSDNLLGLLTCNESKITLEKEDSLLFQTIKSEIRKKRIKSIDFSKDSLLRCFKESYLEKIKYYYIDSIINPDSIAQINKMFEGIFTLEEVEKVGILELFEKIKIPNKLNKLVYNLNSNSIEQEQEQEKEALIENVTEQIKYYQIDSFNFGFDDKLVDWNNTIDVFNNLAIELDDLIHYLPNIFCSYNIGGFHLNNTQMIFVYITELSKVLIVPGYMMGYFIDKYPVFNLSLKLFNNQIVSDIGFIERVKLHPMFKIFNSNEDIVINNETNQIIILLLIFNMNREFNKTTGQQKVFEYFDSHYIGDTPNYVMDKDVDEYPFNNNLLGLVESEIKSKMSRKITEKSIQNISPIIPVNIQYYLSSSDLGRNKYYKDYAKLYLKYKLKYLKLKESM